MLVVQSFVNTPVNSNCYVLFDNEQRKDCIIIDPGSKDDKELIAFITREKLLPKFIILTHEHFDHCWGVDILVERYHIPILCSALCAEAIKDRKRNCSVFFDNVGFTIGSEVTSVESISFHLPFLDNVIEFYNTPGHTDASICFAIEKHLFTGDTLIKDEKTVTKLPTGSLTRLKESMALLTGLQGEGYMVYPGHVDAFALDGYEISKMKTKN